MAQKYVKNAWDEPKFLQNCQQLHIFVRYCLKTGTDFVLFHIN